MLVYVSLPCQVTPVTTLPWCYVRCPLRDLNFPVDHTWQSVWMCGKAHTWVWTCVHRHEAVAGYLVGFLRPLLGIMCSDLCICKQHCLCWVESASMVFFETSEFHLIWLPFLVGEDRENSLNVETESGGLTLHSDSRRRQERVWDQDMMPPGCAGRASWGRGGHS